ncbi:hypothetical protein N7456_008650 [Penicillium angulare]|uniref:Uncharacterized protein n=1 Tax=Penicillium angulare TaxID=116970 RepID=A0A9W9K4I3_9EURO|nr:hypothetical protein N7456_008650 [Penicillium angulare]
MQDNATGRNVYADAAQEDPIENQTAGSWTRRQSLRKSARRLYTIPLAPDNGKEHDIRRLSNLLGFRICTKWCGLDHGLDREWGGDGKKK